MLSATLTVLCYGCIKKPGAKRNAELFPHSARVAKPGHSRTGCRLSPSASEERGEGEASFTLHGQETTKEGIYLSV